MIANATQTAQRFPRAFPRWSRLSIQVKSTGTVTIGKDQGEVQIALNQFAGIRDGIDLNSASTSQPYDFWWKGDLWYAGSLASVTFTLLFVGEATNGFHP